MEQKTILIDSTTGIKITQLPFLYDLKEGQKFTLKYFNEKPIQVDFEVVEVCIDEVCLHPVREVVRVIRCFEQPEFKDFNGKKVNHPEHGKGVVCGYIPNSGCWRVDFDDAPPRDFLPKFIEPYLVK